MVDEARKTALMVLNTLDKRAFQTLDTVFETVLRNNSLLSKRDKALVQALVYGVLRWRARIDWIIEYFSNTPLSKVDPQVLNILRLGIFQITHLSKIPVSAAVNTSVEMAKSGAPSWVVKYVNGLLRTAARKYQSLPFPDIERDPVSALSIKKSFPKWLIKRWLNRFGLKETALICDTINTIPPITVRVNTLKASRESLRKSLEIYSDKIEFTDYAPDGISFFNPRVSIPNIKAFEDGCFQVQDEAAQLVTFLLYPQPGETVLDACAGLGGKTGHMAQMMKNRGRLLAIDKDEKKLLRLEAEMHRLGIDIVTTYAHDLNKPLQAERFERFDRILLDAPCSGLGVLRRNPDAKWKASKQNLADYHIRQVKMLNNLAHLVKPSGFLVYVVCSTEPEENESVVKGFLNKHTEFVIENRPTSLPFKARSLLTDSGYLKTLPHLHNMDGFFSVCFKRI
jgi:16S rRNA (cytosine967-C5)-methyltransferase